MFIINKFKCNAVEFNYSFCFCKIRTAGGCALHCICLTLKALSGYHTCPLNAHASAAHCTTAQCGLIWDCGYRIADCSATYIAIAIRFGSPGFLIREKRTPHKKHLNAVQSKRYYSKTMKRIFGIDSCTTLWCNSSCVTIPRIKNPGLPNAIALR